MAPSGTELDPLRERLTRLEAQPDRLRQPLDDSDLLAARTSEWIADLSDDIDAIHKAAAPLAAVAPPAGSPSRLATVQSAARAALEAVAKASMDVTYLTVPFDTRAKLEQIRAGKALAFDEEFKERVPSMDERTSMLQQSSEYTGDFLRDGIVDLKARKIWRKSSSQAVRVATYFSLLCWRCWRVCSCGSYRCSIFRRTGTCPTRVR